MYQTNNINKQTNKQPILKVYTSVPCAVATIQIKVKVLFFIFLFVIKPLNSITFTPKVQMPQNWHK